MNTGVMTAPPASANTPATVSNNTALATTNTANDAGNAGAGALSLWRTQGIAETFKNVVRQPAVRRVLPLIVMLAVLVVFGLVYTWMQATPYRPVMPGLQEADQQKAFETLKTAEFNPKIDPATGQLTVPSQRFHEARIFLASQGLPKAGATGLDG